MARPVGPRVFASLLAMGSFLLLLYHSLLDDILTPSSAYLDEDDFNSTCNITTSDVFNASNYPLHVKFALLSTVKEKVIPDLVKPGGTNGTKTSGADTRKPWKVLLWNNFHGKTNWYFEMPKKPAPQAVEITWCPTRCVVTVNRDDPKGHDALMFHGRNGHKPLPSVRTPNQLYVFYILESPIYKGGAIMPGNNFYNWTASYSQRSDIFCPYFNFYPQHLQNKSEHLNTAQIERRLKDMENSSLKRKAGLVAWTVSNCRTPSARDVYVKHLRRHIKVDIYGKCGKLKCVNGFDDCYNFISKTHKFYLSFENTICEDYVTEKVAIALLKGMVPVVMGARRYEELLPPHSYIDISKFTSVKQLAEYLIHLDMDNEAYMAYHAWRQYYRIGSRGTIHECVCALCTAMEQRDYLKKRKNVDAHKFWDTKSCDNALVNRLITPKNVKA